jgi:hypothetical protein
MHDDGQTGHRWTERRRIVLRHRGGDERQGDSTMKYDVFLSHSTMDRKVVDQVRDELKALGYRVCVDYEALPAIRPEEVTRETADALLEAMRECSSLVYVLSANSTSSHWMPWELGFFDGARGRVFIWPVDDEAETYAKDRRYVSLYPTVPREGRKAFLAKNLPQERRPQVVPAPPIAARDFAAFNPLLFDHADQKQTAGYAQRLPGMIADPAQAMQAASEIVTAWWRLWGLLPPPRRPGQDR